MVGYGVASTTIYVVMGFWLTVAGNGKGKLFKSFEFSGLLLHGIQVRRINYGRIQSCDHLCLIMLEVQYNSYIPLLLYSKREWLFP